MKIGDRKMNIDYCQADLYNAFCHYDGEISVKLSDITISRTSLDTSMRGSLHRSYECVTNRHAAGWTNSLSVLLIKVVHCTRESNEGCSGARVMKGARVLG